MKKHFWSQDLFEQHPMLGTAAGVAAVSTIGFIALHAVGLRSIQSTLFLCFVVVGIALCVYLGVSLMLMDRKIAKIKQNLEQEKRRVEK